jgi:vacuolar-type H+-ATPase subunit E/Vma4
LALLALLATRVWGSYRRQHDVAEKKVAHITSDAGRKAAEAKRDAYKKKLEQATALYNNADRGVKAELKRLARQRRWKSRSVEESNRQFICSYSVCDAKYVR